MQCDLFGNVRKIAIVVAVAASCGGGAYADPANVSKDLWSNCYPVTPSDVADLAGAPVNGLWIRGGGAVTVLTSNGGTFVIRVADGSTYFPLRIKRVMATGTSLATDIAIAGFTVGIDACL
jgi:hypothetical protein